jgi:hypothetical protein
VYTGYAAGSHYTHGGGGKNTLCLTDTPTWLAFSPANENGSLIFGTEYETSTFGPLAALQNFDARCAVCLRPASVVLMIPGAAVCPASWNLEYAGYLMSTQFGQSAGQTVCVDQNAQPTGSVSDSNGNLWYATEAECGALPCPPYVQDREVTCSVCTR